MFSFFRRSRLIQSDPVTSIDRSSDSDRALIAVISAAIARFRAEETPMCNDVGFVVRRVRRV
jgi:hypothetical protein